MTEPVEPEEAFRLCYIDGPWAWFTTAALEDQWGDDWNDAPYECNAGQPYGWRMGQRSKSGGEVPPYLLRRVAWDGPLESPDAWGQRYSVEDINAGRAPWLVTAKYTTGPQVVIPAGTSLPAFIALVGQAHGRVYVRHGDMVTEAQKPAERLEPTDPCPCGGHHVAADHDMVMAAEQEAQS